MYTSMYTNKHYQTQPPLQNKSFFSAPTQASSNAIMFKPRPSHQHQLATACLVSSTHRQRRPLLISVTDFIPLLAIDDGGCCAKRQPLAILRTCRPTVVGAFRPWVGGLEGSVGVGSEFPPILNTNGINGRHIRREKMRKVIV